MIFDVSPRLSPCARVTSLPALAIVVSVSSVLSVVSSFLQASLYEGLNHRGQRALGAAFGRNQIGGFLRARPTAIRRSGLVDSLGFKLKQTGLAEIVRNNGWQGQKCSGWPWLIDAKMSSSKTASVCGTMVVAPSVDHGVLSSGRFSYRSRRDTWLPTASCRFGLVDSLLVIHSVPPLRMIRRYCAL